eukprot:1360377-Amorphochlora_amoeboformis.AAC.1
MQEISGNVLTSRTHRNLQGSSGSVTWRDVTLCHRKPDTTGYYPVVPGITRHYPILPGTTRH